MNASQLILSSVSWKRHPGHGSYFYYDDGDTVAVLRINNFPEEVLFTLINGMEIIDLEDRPVGWTLEQDEAG